MDILDADGSLLDVVEEDAVYNNVRRKEVRIDRP